MLRTSAIALCISASLLVPLVAQERVKQQKLTVPEYLEAATRAYNDQRFGLCLTHLREATAAVSADHSRAIRAALPDAPEGFEKLEAKGSDDMANNPFAAALAGSVGSTVSQEYKSTGGRERIECRVTANSPMLQMMSMWINNPAMLDKDSEVIKYGPHNAVLKSVQDGRRYELKIIVGESLIEVDAQGISDDDVLKFMDQAAVDRLVRVLED